MPASVLRNIAIATLLSACCGVATAQYVWQDEKGVRQYSDQPPPASVPNSRILKSPGMQRQPAASAPAPANTDAESAAQAPTLAERNADFQKRRAETAEKEKQAADKAKQDADRKKACDQTAQYRRALESGERISRMTPSGERAYLTDEERAEALRETQRQQEHCK